MTILSNRCSDISFLRDEMIEQTTRHRLFFVALGLVIALALIAEDSAVADELPPAPEGSFSIVVIPDTQHYRGTGTKLANGDEGPLTNKVFDGWTDWIAASLDRQRIVFVSHVGDIVDINNRKRICSIANGQTASSSNAADNGVSISRTTCGLPQPRRLHW